MMDPTLPARIVNGRLVQDCAFTPESSFTTLCDSSVGTPATNEAKHDDPPNSIPNTPNQSSNTINSINTINSSNNTFISLHSNEIFINPSPAAALSKQNSNIIDTSPPQSSISNLATNSNNITTINQLNNTPHNPYLDRIRVTRIDPNNTTNNDISTTTSNTLIRAVINPHLSAITITSIDNTDTTVATNVTNINSAINNSYLASNNASGSISSTTISDNININISNNTFSNSINNNRITSNISNTYNNTNNVYQSQPNIDPEDQKDGYAYE